MLLSPKKKMSPVTAYVEGKCRVEWPAESLSNGSVRRAGLYFFWGMKKEGDPGTFWMIFVLINSYF